MAMKKGKSWCILSVVTVLCFLLVGTAVAAEKTIRIGSPFKSGTIVVDAAEKFKDIVEKGSGGRIEVTIDADTKAEIEINKMNKAGELEMQSNGTNFLELYAPRTTSSPTPTS
jgi:TRAP-type C4-dicarboxylate transport system substrate-binding protein